MPQRSVVFIPSRRGGRWFYYTYASSSYEAARQAIEQHVARVTHEPLLDDAVLTIVVGGTDSNGANYQEHNAKKPTYRHTVGQLRRRPALCPVPLRWSA